MALDLTDKMKPLEDLISEAQMLSAVLYGADGSRGFIHEFRDVTAVLRSECDRLTELSGQVYESMSDRVSEVESNVEYVLQSLNRLEKESARLTLLDDPDRWVENVKTSMAIRFAEDPLFERVFSRMAEAAMAQASGQFFADLEHQMRTVLGDVVAEKGGVLPAHKGGKSSDVAFVQVKKTTWMYLVGALVFMVIFSSIIISWVGLRG